MPLDSGLLELLFKFLLICVIGGHFFFAYGQWFKWPELCKKLTDLTGDEVEKTAFLGRSFASYNFSVGLGLLLSLLFLNNKALQAVVLALIAITALVGANGTKGNTILLMRFLPAFSALLLLFISYFL